MVNLVSCQLCLFRNYILLRDKPSKLLCLALPQLLLHSVVACLLTLEHIFCGIGVQLGVTMVIFLEEAELGLPSLLFDLRNEFVAHALEMA